MKLLIFLALVIPGCFYLDDNGGPFAQELYRCTFTWPDAEDTRLVCMSDLSTGIRELHAECNYECALSCSSLVIPCSSEDT